MSDGRYTVVRAPNPMGEFIMALPAMQAAAPAMVLVRPGLVPLCRATGLADIVLPVDRGTASKLRAIAQIRRLRLTRGITFVGSFSSVLTFAAAGVRERRGEPGDRKELLLTHCIAPAYDVHRTARYMRITTGVTPDEPPRPRFDPSELARQQFRALVPPAASRPVGLFPGSSCSARRWDPARFREVARRLSSEGHQVLVFGGPEEVALTREVAGDHALDLGGQTEVSVLAAGLEACRLLVSNDTGPMHLAAAVDTPVVAFFGVDSPFRIGPLVTPRHLFWPADLPCRECFQQTCPRTGPGTFLPQAERECLNLVSVDDAMAAIHALLPQTRG